MAGSISASAAPAGARRGPFIIGTMCIRGAHAAGNDAPPPAEIAFEQGHTRLQRLARFADRHRFWMFAAILALYAAGWAPHWFVSPDSGHTLIIARSLARGEGYGHPTGYERRVPPGFPWLAGGAMRVARTESAAPVNVLTLAAGLANLALAFWLFHLHAGRLTAVAVTIMLALAETYYRYCYEPRADQPFVTGLLLSLVGLERLERGRPRPAVSALLCAGGVVVMALMRSVVLVAVAGLAAGLGWTLLRRRRYGTLLAAAGLGLAALLVARAIDPSITGGGFGADERITVRTLTQELPQTLHDAVTRKAWVLFAETYSRAAFGGDFGPWVNLPLGVLVFALGLGLARRRPVWGMLVAAFTAQWLLFFVDRRYVLPLLPLLAFAVWHAVAWVYVRRPSRWRRRAAFALLSLWIGVNGGRVLRMIDLQHDPHFIERHENGRYAGLDRVAAALREGAPPGAVVLADPQYCSALMFWSERAALSVPASRLQRADSAWALRPLPPGTEGTLAREGWRDGDRLVEVERPAGHPPFRLARLLRPEP